MTVIYRYMTILSKMNVCPAGEGTGELCEIICEDESPYRKCGAGSGTGIKP